MEARCFASTASNISFSLGHNLGLVYLVSELLLTVTRRSRSLIMS
jgi:hypothetical protein